MSVDPRTGDTEELWREYLAATAARDARPLLARVLEELPGGGRALDLGCGAGGDTLALLGAGFEVLAVDGLAEALAHTRHRAEEAGLAARLSTRHARFEELVLPPRSLELVFASYSLPFCPRPAFGGLWASLAAALVPGGVLAGQLFGDRDEWVGERAHPAQVFHSRAELDRRLAGFELLHLEELEERRRTALGDEKDWHVFTFVARRPRS